MSKRLNTGIKYALLAALVAVAVMGVMVYQARFAAKSGAQQKKSEQHAKDKLNYYEQECIKESKDNLCFTAAEGYFDYSYSYSAGWPLRFLIAREYYQTQSLSRRSPEMKVFWGGLAADFLIYFGGTFIFLLVAGAVRKNRRPGDPNPPVSDAKI